MIMKSGTTVLLSAKATLSRLAPTESAPLGARFTKALVKQAG
jgi:hypothetical protein